MPSRAARRAPPPRPKEPMTAIPASLRIARLFTRAAFDSQAALLKQRPCADKIRYNVNADGTYRLDASASDCEDRYKSTQQKLYAQTKWRVVGDTFTVSATDFAVGQSYKVSVSGNRMTWVGTEDQGTVVFQR